MSDLIFRPLRYRDRWFAYLDLLGFRRLVQTNAIEDVLPIYSEALKRMRKASEVGKKEVGLLNSWFSDTFIIYSRSNSLEDFAHVESAARVFFELLLVKRIPVRGCISHGKLYSQAKQNIFVGPALIEAHRYSESLDWVGFCLAPSVEEALQSKLPLGERPHYRKLSDRRVLGKLEVDHLYAFALNNGTMNGRNPFRQALEAMKLEAPPEATQKYVNTLAFLDRFSKPFVPPLT